jgi:hypothetical protein
MISIFVFIWMRGTLPRLRQDQLMNFAWKFVLPFTLLEPAGDRALAFHGRGMGALGGVHGDSRWGLCADGPREHAQEALRPQEIPLC